MVPCRSDSTQHAWVTVSRGTLHFAGQDGQVVESNQDLMDMQEDMLVMPLRSVPGLWSTNIVMILVLEWTWQLLPHTNFWVRGRWTIQLFKRDPCWCSDR